jgi:HK97 family phage portal protein
MGIFDFLGPLNAGQKRRGWDALPALPSERKSVPGPITTTTYGPGYWTPTTTAAALTATATGAGNSAVFACLESLAVAIAEPELRLYRTAGSERVELPQSPLGDLIARPNPVFSLDTLLGYLVVSLHVEGNAYWRKLRAGHPLRGNVVELWPISPTRMTPFTQSGSADFITHYTYTSAAGRAETIDPANIVHVRYGLDDADHRLGYAPLKRLVAEISSDAQATRYADRLLANLAINGLTLAFDKDAPVISQEQADELKARLATTFGGDNAGAAAVLSPGATLSSLGFSPEQMDLKVLHRVPEERISAVLGVPAIVAGLGAGLDRSTYSNFREAREAFTEQKLIPLWRRIAGELTLQLVPDFTPDQAIVVDFDIGAIRALADDENAKATRLKALVDGGILTKDEARAELGYDPLPNGLGEAREPVVLIPPAPADAARSPVPAAASVRVSRKVALGPALTLDDGELDRGARVTSADLAAAERFWREAVDGTGLEDLLDAQPDEDAD